MRYTDTWFGKQPVTGCSGGGNNRQLWLHNYVDVVTGGLKPMHHENPDGSIDVLGACVLRLCSGISCCGHSRDKMHKALDRQEELLTRAGAILVRRTKNHLVMRYGRETAHYVVSYVRAETFFKNLK